MSLKIHVIGSGFAGLSAACHLARSGHQVKVLEKNTQVGGRARSLSLDGFTYDMGPSWYWMPDVFDHFFAQFGRKTSDYYQLLRLDPSYGVKFKDSYLDIPASYEEFEGLFESIEPGSSRNLRKFLKQAAYKYSVGIQDLVYKPCRSISEFMDIRLLYGLLKMDVFTSMRKHIHSFFKEPRLRQLMEFPILFLGGTPDNTPALYSLMNYADIKLGTWYPQGGMISVVNAMKSLAEEMGVEFELDTEVKSFGYDGKRISTVITNKGDFLCDLVVAGADYHHVDQHILHDDYKQYSPAYWDKRTLAPSSLLFYVGVNKQLPRLRHHTLFFDEDFNQHAKEIYDDPQWPTSPLLYTSATSRTDPDVAPAGCENLVILIPVAPDLQDAPEIREHYYQMSLDRLEKFTGTTFRSDVVVMKSYAHKDFSNDYHSLKGNAYGLANTLRQTAILKPRLKNSKLKNLFYTGQLTVPGPGVPPSLISGEIVAREINKEFT